MNADVKVGMEEVRDAVSVLLAGSEWGEDEVTVQVEFLNILGIEVTS